MLSLQTNSFYAWKQNPDGFFNRHKELFARIIRKKYCCGHLNDIEFNEKVRLIGKRMSSKSALNSLNMYSQKVTFLVYYVKILENEIVAYSQTEDMMLMDKEPRTLVLKYKPLVGFLISKIVTTRKTIPDIKQDLEQDVLLGLIDKTDYVKKHYKPNMLFRNYLWSIIYYSLLNHLKSKKYSNFSESNPDEVFRLVDKVNDYDFIFCLYEGFRQLGNIMFDYEYNRAKLEICLKVIFSIPISYHDLYALFNNNDHIHSTPSNNMLEIACNELNIKTQAAGFSQIQRFSIIAPILNSAFNAQSQTRSYIHWTNEQIDKIIQRLNQHGTRCFNRETLSIMLEMYFMKYCENNALNREIKVVNYNKEADRNQTGDFTHQP